MHKPYLALQTEIKEWDMKLSRSRKEKHFLYISMYFIFHVIQFWNALTHNIADDKSCHRFKKQIDKFLREQFSMSDQDSYFI